MPVVLCRPVAFRDSLSANSTSFSNQRPVPPNSPKGQSMQCEQGDFRVYQCQRCSSSPTRMSRLIRASRFPTGHSMCAGEHAGKRWQPLLGQAACAISSPAASAKRETWHSSPLTGLDCTGTASLMASARMTDRRRTTTPSKTRVRGNG